MANILILYNYYKYPVRATHYEHLYSFKKYSSHRCFYINLVVRKIPWYIKRYHWDLIIFHTFFLSSRWSREYFIRNTQKIRFLKDSDAIKVALPQDEFLNMDLVCDFINEFDIDHVFSVAPESEWPVIYRTADLRKVKLHKVLTGYIDDAVINKVNKISKRMPEERPIDIGYRVTKPAFWLGSHGILKWRIADIFKEKAIRRGLLVDISTDVEDTLLGDDWYRFLLCCKYQIGVEGGASILDWDGTYRKNTEEYLSNIPDASFDEVERACFPGADGSLRLYALAPRNLDACVTKTCQVLIEGDYDGVLISGKHFIELKRDLGNLDEVLDIIAEDELRNELTMRAWQDIVQSGKYSYRQFVEYVFQTTLGEQEWQQKTLPKVISEAALWRLERLFDYMSWFVLAILSHTSRIIKRVLPNKTYLNLMDLLKRRL